MAKKAAATIGGIVLATGIFALTGSHGPGSVTSMANVVGFVAIAFSTCLLVCASSGRRE